MAKILSKNEIAKLSANSKKIFDNAPMSIITIDKNRFITSANKFYQTFSSTRSHQNHNIFKSEFFKREKLVSDYKKLLLTGAIVKRETCYEKNNKGEDKYLKIIAVPLKDKNGKIKGALSMAIDNTEVVSLKNNLEELNRGLEIKIKERTAELEIANKELEHLGTHDSLTGLRNRNFFEKRLQELRKRKCYEGGVLMIDIDDLKKINDGLGHLAGDVIIKQVAKLIEKEFRKHDLVARIGGDEFCVLLSAIKPAEINVAIKRLNAKIHKARKQNGIFSKLSVSIGMAHTLSGRDLDNALKIADKQMYAEKKLKKQINKR